MGLVALGYGFSGGFRWSGSSGCRYLSGIGDWGIRVMGMVPLQGG